MPVMSDKWINSKVISDKMIDPFVPSKVSKGVISYGLSSYGYDARVGNKFKVFTNINSSCVDPKNFQSSNLVEKEGDFCIIPPNSFALGCTIEYFKIPRDVIVLCVGKSTYARCGIIINVTPLEPCWEGYVTLEFSNTTPLPAKIYSNEGVCQFLFLQGDTECITAYNESGGKYMNQNDITLPKVG
jgi:dCTP deaminase